MAHFPPNSRPVVAGAFLPAALSVLCISGACGRSSLSGAASATDLSTPPPGDASTVACNRLRVLGSTMLGSTQGNDYAPAVAYDGAKFAVAWLAEKAGNPPNASMRFTRLDRSGRAEAKEGLALGDARLGIKLGLEAGQAGEYAVLFTPAPTATSGTHLSLVRFTATGALLGKVLRVGGMAMSAALAPAPAGYAAVFTEPSSLGYIKFALVDRSGKVAQQMIHSGQMYNDLWLAQNSKGFAIGWWGMAHHFALLNPAGAFTTPVREVALRLVPAAARYASAGDGYALVFLERRGSSTSLHAQTLTSTGLPQGGPVQVATSVSSAGNMLALVWTGQRYVVVYNQSHPNLKARVLHKDGRPAGAAVDVPPCMLTARSPEIAWGSGTLAVAYEGGLSGLPKTNICVSRLECAP